MKHIKDFLRPVFLFVFAGIVLSGCQKDHIPARKGNRESYVAKTTFTDKEIEQMAQAHNDYLLDMINYGVHDRNSLIDYLYDNFEGFRSISRDSINTLLDMQASFTKQDLLNPINDNASQFKDAKTLTRYLTDADQYLTNFDINFLNELESQARTELTGIDRQVFYAYISVMKKSKEFWVDSGYLDDLNTQAQARAVVQADATAAVLGICATLLVGLAVGIFNPAAGVAILSSKAGWATVAVGAALTSIGEAVS